MSYKICVYAIAKNEIKFIDRFFNSVREADYVCVLDTGSTDGSFEKFQSLGIITQQKVINPFRFDTARNESMSLIPADTDICVCVDIDEYFEAGWSEILKEFWSPTTGRVRYRYTWNFNPDGSEGTVFLADKIHKYGCYHWVNPVHEVLKENEDIPKDLTWLTLPTIQLNHKADNTKSRSNYLPLLEQSVLENPQDDRNAHYLGREYMFHAQYEKAIEMLKYHLTLKTANWDEERCASMRYIARSYKNLGNPSEAENYLLKAILECPNTREPYYELAVLYYEEKDYLKSAAMLTQMLKIKERQLNYISSPECWSSLPYDYLSLCYHFLGQEKKAIENVLTAIKLSPHDQRLSNNLKIFIDAFNQSEQNRIKAQTEAESENKVNNIINADDPFSK